MDEGIDVAAAVEDEVDGDISVRSVPCKLLPEPGTSKTSSRAKCDWRFLNGVAPLKGSVYYFWINKVVGFLVVSKNGWFRFGPPKRLFPFLALL